jgi:hypothetical protein
MTATTTRSQFGWRKGLKVRFSALVQCRVTNDSQHNKIEREFGGRDRVRTCDPLLAKQVLSQLSYTPIVTTAESLYLNNACEIPRQDGVSRILTIPGPLFGSVQLSSD